VTRAAKGCLLIALIPVVYLLIVLGSIQWTLYRGQQDQDAILVAIKSQYPDLVFRGGHSYEAQRVYLKCLNVQDPAKQMEIRDWLAEFKAEHKIGSVIWLMFDEEGREPPEKFKL
jgi:hypothetical protein